MSSKPIIHKDPLSLQHLELGVSSFGHSFYNLLFLPILTLGLRGIHCLGELVIPGNAYPI